MYYLGYDLGTSSVKVLVMDKEGKILASSYSDYPIFYPDVNYAEQDPLDWWEKTCQAIKTLVKDFPLLKSNIRSISFSGQMHGLVLLGENDKLLMPAILWCDQRTENECKDIYKNFGIDGLRDYTGNAALPGFTGPKLLWVKKNKPEIFQEIKKIMLPKDYIHYMFTGIHATDVSDASGTLFFDVEKRRWSKEMIEFFGIKEEQLPKVYESYEQTGFVKESVKEDLGLSLDRQIKVTIGAGDQAAGAIGSGVVKEGISSVVLGSSGVLFFPSDKFFVDEKTRLHSFCHANGKYHQMGVILSAASCLKWWIDNIQKDTQDPYNLLLDEAKSVEIGSNNLFFLPYLMGERTPYSDPDARGCFIGLKIDHTRAHMTRAILEGVIFALRDCLEIIKDIGVDIKEIRLSGGGARSHLWRQIVADILGIKVVSTNSKEGPAFGAAILAAVGDGLYESVDEACSRLVQTTDEIYPIKENVEKYNKHYDIYTGLYGTLEATFKGIKDL